MRLTLVLVLALAVTVPALAATAVAPEPAMTLQTAAASAEGELTVEELENLLLPEALEASSCTVSARCADGTTISCSGNLCFANPQCFVYCDGYTTYCNNLCP